MAQQPSQLPTPQPSTGPLSREPVITLTVVYSLVAAILLALTAWGINVSADKQHAIEAIIGVIFPIVASLHIRSIVWSPLSVKNAEQGKPPAGG